MKILNIITTLLIIGYAFCWEEGEGLVFNLPLDFSFDLDLSSFPNGTLFSNYLLYFRFEKGNKPTLIHLTLPEGVTKEDFRFEYHSFETNPLDGEIYDAYKDFKQMELYDEVEYEGDAKEYTYIVDNEKPFMTVLFICKVGIKSFNILVENYGEGDDTKMNIYDVKNAKFYDIKLAKAGEYYYFGLNSIQENTGPLVLEIIVPHGSKIPYFIYGFPLKNGKIEELSTIEQTKEQLKFENIGAKIDETCDSYRYLFHLNEDKKYFLIFVTMETPIENLQVYITQQNIGKVIKNNN